MQFRSRAMSNLISYGMVLIWRRRPCSKTEKTPKACPVSWLMSRISAWKCQRGWICPHRFQPIHRRKPNGDVDARPWCQGFHAAMRLRLPAWAPLLDLSDINHGLLLPILLHCVDDHGHPLLGWARKGRETEEFLRNAHTDIPAVVEAMRQYWMPTRYARAG
jgi:hypothetical protein